MNHLPPPGSLIHLIAVCGVGMASLAGLLQARGYRVTGSDHNVYPPMSSYLAEIGIPVFKEYNAEHLTPRPDLVIIGNAVSSHNPEAEAVLAQGIPYLSFPQALGAILIGSRSSLVITGTHGKTTTTALAAWVLTRANLAPGFFVGGVPVNFGSGWNTGNGEHVVVEGDEYDSAFFDKGPKFLHYRPSHVILTSIEFDHADIYQDLGHVKQAFGRLMDIIPAAGRLLVCNDYPAALEVAQRSRCRMLTYGDAPGADWTAAILQMREGKSIFNPSYRGKPEGVVEAGVIGRHNVKNALAVYAMAREMGVNRSDLLNGLATFAGVRRRQEVKGERRGILIIDDFAHHPTAVRETIEAVKEAYRSRRLWAIFEPRSNTSRRKIFEREFAQALAPADRVILASPYQPERVAENDRISVDRVIEMINSMGDGTRGVVVAAAQQIAEYVAENAVSGDIVLVMSNGGFDDVHEKIFRALAG